MDLERQDAELAILACGGIAAFLLMRVAVVFAVAFIGDLLERRGSIRRGLAYSLKAIRVLFLFGIEMMLAGRSTGGSGF